MNEFQKWQAKSFLLRRSNQDHTSQDHFCSVINEFPVWNSKSFKPRWWDKVSHPEREAVQKIHFSWTLMIAYCTLMCSDGCATVWVAFKLRINRANWFQLWWLWRLRRPWRLLTTLTTLRIFKVANSKRNQNKKKKKKFMANSTQCSQAVSHPSTN